jgi:membrane protease YdiL (CAAX protease family)
MSSERETASPFKTDAGLPPGPSPEDAGPVNPPGAIDADNAGNTLEGSAGTESPGEIRTAPAEIPPPSSPPGLSSAQRFNERRDQVEREFREVQRACVFYAALLVPLLGLHAWCFHREDADVVAAQVWISTLLYSVVVSFAWFWRHELRGRFAWPRAAKPWVWAAVVITPAVTVTSASIMVSLVRTWGWPAESATIDYLMAEWPEWAIYVWIAVLPAVFEETAFRGLMLGKLRHVMTPVQAIWVSSILFGILHFSIVGLAVFLVPLAWVAGWLTHRTGSLWPAVIIHFLHNAGIVTLEFFG